MKGNSTKFFVLIIIKSIFLIASSQKASWQLGPFIKQDNVNPIMGPINYTTFYCPVRQEVINWEAKDIFNPGAIVRDNKIHMLYRAEDFEGIYNGTSRIGLALSTDGINFDRLPEPVFYPNLDPESIFEWEGGCEDPRIVQFINENGTTYFMTYTAYDGELARLMVASSPNLFSWNKHGSVFKNAGDRFLNLWSKSGSIVTQVVNGTQEAVKVLDKFWMYWGETSIFGAWSEDLINWNPVTDDVNGTQFDHNLTAVFSPRAMKFDSDIVEPGPPAILTEDGIVLIYNSRNKDPKQGGDATLPLGTYSAGQVLTSAENPMQVIDRLEDYFFTPDRDYEVIGQVNNVVFLEGLVQYNGTWFLYYGTADSKIAVAKS